MSVCAIILAGGQASRMQGEKPLRLLRGKTLLEHSRDLVAPLADEILVASGARDLPLPAGVAPVPDAAEFKGRGPLAGVLAGLEATGHGRAIVLACDVPNVPTTLLERLLHTLGDDCDCCWTQHNDHPEPLVAALNVAPARVAVRKALENGAHKVVPCWASMAHRVLGEDELAEFAPLERAFANLNTLADLERESQRDS
ncbi:MAG: molybdenum cofactor guanylyltransferase [Planctomycetes bacterium]|nr:molybdenum cofactor guanylyltransferase [Planctomycetota bacterium]